MSVFPYGLCFTQRAISAAMSNPRYVKLLQFRETARVSDFTACHRQILACEDRTYGFPSVRGLFRGFSDGSIFGVIGLFGEKYDEIDL